MSDRFGTDRTDGTGVSVNLPLPAREEGLPNLPSHASRAARDDAAKSAETARPVVGRPFQPGQSGNPTGRPKGLAKRARELVGDDGTRVLEFLATVMDDESARLGDRIEAAKLLLERGFGRAPIEVQGELAPVFHLISAFGGVPGA